MAFTTCAGGVGVPGMRLVDGESQHGAGVQGYYEGNANLFDQNIITLTKRRQALDSVCVPSRKM